MKKKKIVKVDLFKFLRGVFILFVFIFVISFFIGKKIYSHDEVKNKDIYITKDETLWSVASYEQENNEFYKDKSIDYVMNDIKELNNMDLSMIYEGQTLKVNTY